MKKFGTLSAHYSTLHGDHNDYAQALQAVIEQLNEMDPCAEVEIIKIQHIQTCQTTEFNDTETVAGLAVVVYSYDDTAEKERERKFEELAAAFR